MNEYVIQQGDNLSKIAKLVYGAAKLWSKIASDNNISNPNDIRVGQVLKINTLKKDTPTSTNKYTIKSGDNLSKIASQYNTTIDEILRLNSISNPNVIIVGQKLVLPK
jgi:lysozyme